MHDDQDFLPRVRRQMWALIAVYSVGVAILVVWTTPFESHMRPIASVVLAAVFALVLRFWNVRKSLAAVRSWKQEFGASPVDARASAWEIARHLVSEKYVDELRKARDSKRTLLAWSIEYALRVVILFAVMYLFLAGWMFVQSGLAGLQTAQFREGTRLYLIDAIILGPLFLLYLVIDEIFRRRKR